MSTDPHNLDLSAEAGAAGPIHETVTLDSGLKTPDVTPAQLVAFIPLLAEFGHAFGIYDLSQAQQDSLSKLVIGAIALIGGDAVIRLGRNLRKRL